jgi:hypothetical protein
LYPYLTKCAEAGGGILDESREKIIAYNFRNRSLHSSGDLAMIGEKNWGTNPKAILKYLVLRYWNER